LRRQRTVLDVEPLGTDRKQNPPPSNVTWDDIPPVDVLALGSRPYRLIPLVDPQPGGGGADRITEARRRFANRHGAGGCR